jgi:hypothetical protein
LASIYFKRASLALFAPPSGPKPPLALPDRTYRQQPSTHHGFNDIGRAGIDVEKSYGQKAAFAVGALR